MTLDDIIKLVERDLPEYDWLVRNDPKGGFANLLLSARPVPVISLSTGKVLGNWPPTHPTWAGSPAKALFAAYSNLMSDLGRKPS